ncbi:MAG: short-chain dehydrogenase [Rhodospirillales bacterium RIFCSPLOWO2_12_FULL_58_28]|nr:MAG: short-chain dehydrogenase [Rhodospirillales bacterium RIFCSPLOWO2_02_FULL_58_16]OHC76728.1 MAG: short-chain dehydrogenase [Rhodospirillales bacterium RIFCSPLOWO2_12_FULL_58_28]
MSDIFDLSGKVAVVTGGAGIIGTPVCKGLAEHGAAVAVVDVNGAAAKTLAEQIADEFGVKAIGVLCDVSSPQSVAEMAKTVCDKLGGIHILHNNAATKAANMNDFFASFEDFKLETWREIMAVNLDGMFLVAQAVGKQMIKQGNGGSIIQTSSIYGIVAPHQKIYEISNIIGKKINTPAVYSASKAAVIGLTRYLAAYWADKGIRVNTLVPGGVESGQDGPFLKAYNEHVPMGRMAQAEEMVGAVVYLASDASSYMTGQMMTVDGGWTAW